MDPQITDETPEDLSGVPEHQRPVAQRWGRARYEFVLLGGVAEHAEGRLSEALGQHPARAYLGRLVAAYNALARRTIEREGWTEAELQRCHWDIEAAERGKVIIARG